MKKLVNKATLAYYSSTVLAALATIIVTPFSAGLSHQPDAPKELYKK
ncbi:AgrD family cyclic lactone autoinducer peptide [Brevibacillus reuszeri]|nr:cyclic lactone autoinducer peptide [Brevibacillus reuszeri]